MIIADGLGLNVKINVWQELVAATVLCDFCFDAYNNGAGGITAEEVKNVFIHCAPAWELGEITTERFIHRWETKLIPKMYFLASEEKAGVKYYHLEPSTLYIPREGELAAYTYFERFISLLHLEGILVLEGAHCIEGKPGFSFLSRFFWYYSRKELSDKGYAYEDRFFVAIAAAMSIGTYAIDDVYNVYRYLEHFADPKIACIAWGRYVKNEGLEIYFYDSRLDDVRSWDLPSILGDSWRKETPPFCVLPPKISRLNEILESKASVLRTSVSMKDKAYLQISPSLHARIMEYKILVAVGYWSLNHIDPLGKSASKLSKNLLESSEFCTLFEFDGEDFP